MDLIVREPTGTAPKAHCQIQTQALPAEFVNGLLERHFRTVGPAF
jgi:hypothetical protein